MSYSITLCYCWNKHNVNGIYFVLNLCKLAKKVCGPNGSVRESHHISPPPNKEDQEKSVSVWKWLLLHTCVYKCFDCIIQIYSTQLCAKSFVKCESGDK